MADCSKGYFQSKNCMRELVASVTLQKPVIALIDLDASRGGLSLEEVQAQLVDSDKLAVKWAFAPPEAEYLNKAPNGMEYQHAYAWPGGQALYESLTDAEPIEWNRIGHFQDVTMRLIAERLLANGCTDEQNSPLFAKGSAQVRKAKQPDGRFGGAGAPADRASRPTRYLETADTTYVDRELVAQKIDRLRAPRKQFHVYCSVHNPGAAALMQELARKQGMTVTREMAAWSRWTSSGALSPKLVRDLASAAFETAEVVTRTTSRRSQQQRGTIWPRRRTSHRAKDTLVMATDHASLLDSDQMLLYLTGQTWTRGDDSAALGKEVLEAMENGVTLLLAHEMPGIGGQAERSGVEFSTFFSCPEGATPDGLLKLGIYSQIAVPLKGGAWRNVSMRLLAKSVALTADDAARAKDGDDVLDLGDSAAAQMSKRLKRVLGSSKRLSFSQPRASSTLSAAKKDDAPVVGRSGQTSPESTTVNAVKGSIRIRRFVPTTKRATCCPAVATTVTASVAETSVTSHDASMTSRRLSSAKALEEASSDAVPFMLPLGATPSAEGLAESSAVSHEPSMTSRMISPAGFEGRNQVDDRELGLLVQDEHV